MYVLFLYVNLFMAMAVQPTDADADVLGTIDGPGMLQCQKVSFLQQ
jgi:hypothetical protein